MYSDTMLMIWVILGFLYAISLVGVQVYLLFRALRILYSYHWKGVMNEDFRELLNRQGEHQQRPGFPIQYHLILYFVMYSLWNVVIHPYYAKLPIDRSSPLHWNAM